jgi:hypothetical protein
MKVQVYSDVSEKKSVTLDRSLSPKESLIRCLDLLDFNRALVKSSKFTFKKKQSNSINWIELSFLKK